MIKSELITAMAEKSGLSKQDTTKALDAFIGVVGEAMIDNNPIQLVGFGTFSVQERAARTGRNPQTGEPLEIKASKTVKFKAGKGLKDAVNL